VPGASESNCWKIALDSPVILNWQVHEYDTVLKSLLTDSPNSLFHLITGAKRGRWLNVELPKVVQARVDLLFELAATRELILLELQSHNDPHLPVRMTEYYKRFPKMYVLYRAAIPPMPFYRFWPGLGN